MTFEEIDLVGATEPADPLGTWKSAPDTERIGELAALWRQAPPTDVSTLVRRLCAGGLGFLPPLVATVRPNATLSVPGCVPPVQLQFETLAEDSAAGKAQRALDDVLDTLSVRPLARVARPRSP